MDHNLAFFFPTASGPVRRSPEPVRVARLRARRRWTFWREPYNVASHRLQARPNIMILGHERSPHSDATVFAEITADLPQMCAIIGEVVVDEPNHRIQAFNAETTAAGEESSMF